MTQTVAGAPDETEVRADRPRPFRLPLRFAVPLAAVAGAVSVLAFPRTYWWPALPLGVGTVTVALYGRRLRTGALLGGVYGLAYFFPLLFWLRVLGYDAWTALSLIETLYVAAMGAGIALVSRLRLWPLWSACLWVLQELVRGHVPFGGFSWGRLAFGETHTPYTALASLGGAPLVTFAVALTGSLLAWAVLRLTTHTLGAALAVAGAVLVACSGLFVPAPHATGRSVTVAVVQGNVPQEGLDFLGQREAVLRNHAAATHQLAAEIRAGKVPEPDFVVWPENASDVDPIHDPGARAIVTSAVQDVGVPVLVGGLVLSNGGKRLTNTGIVWDPSTGPGQEYSKRQLVPFGEYVPLRPLMTRLVGRLDRIPQDFTPGTTPGRLRVGGVRVGDVMCYEVAYDQRVRSSMAGASLLTVQTNNATYGGTLQLDQQFSISRLRAVEHGRPVAIAATSGISAVIDQRGDVLAESRQFTRAMYVRRVPVVDAVTLADRVGPWPERGLAIVGLLAMVGAVISWRRARATQTTRGAT
ncbi:MAG: apolipoprotein N-acyltransferase [Streptosporangiales bacterium]|nr:apolipoprotein N-acyltransferase [Streptosporangiales bacterium]